LGLSLTIYDPALDPDRSGARQLVHLLEAILVPEKARDNQRGPLWLRAPGSSEARGSQAASSVRLKKAASSS
jgi:hypothetical protein